MGGFCEPNLQGLPEAPAIDLVGVPDGDQCLHRVSARKGIWQHDPNRPGGTDYVGPLTDLCVVAGATVPSGASAGYGHIPMLVEGYGPNNEATLCQRSQEVSQVNRGWLAMLTQDPSGKLHRTDRLVPSALSGCPDNLYFLGFEKVIRQCGNREYTEYAMKELSKIVLPSSQVSAFTAEDAQNQDTFRVVAAKKTGNCWEFGLAPPSGCAYASVIEESDEFDAFLVCKDGSGRKVPGVEGKWLVGTASGTWKYADGGVMTMLDTWQLVAGQLNDPHNYLTNSTLGAAIPQQTPLSGQYDVTAHDIPSTAKIAWVRAETCANVANGVTTVVAKVIVNGQTISFCWNIVGGVTTDRDSIVYPAKLTDGKFTYQVDAQHTGDGGSYAYLHVIGWQ